MSAQSPASGRILRKGFYPRSSDSRKVPRYFCKTCRGSLSSARLGPCFRQKKRKLNAQVRSLLCSGVSQRRIARLLGINRKTVVRKLLFLAEQAMQSQREYLAAPERPEDRIQAVQFDEMETFECSKCLPLSIPLVVDAGIRKILGFGVCSIPGDLGRVSQHDIDGLMRINRGWD